MSRFIKWDTPFVNSKFPSAVILIQDNSARRDCVSALVSPSGIDEYPKYLVHFGDVIAFTCMEEMHFPNRGFEEVDCEETGLASYQVIDSPWLESYRNGEFFLFNLDGGNREVLRHYMIFGGDNNIEVITKNDPTFEVVNSPRVLSLDYHI
jgi:hypothetical protein